MCMTNTSTLTLASLLRDPLIQMMMQSDNVSEWEHAALLHRVQRSLAGRGSPSARTLEQVE
jgi:hypothetical protein